MADPQQSGGWDIVAKAPAPPPTSSGGWDVVAKAPAAPAGAQDGFGKSFSDMSGASLLGHVLAHPIDSAATVLDAAKQVVSPQSGDMAHNANPIISSVGQQIQSSKDSLRKGLADYRKNGLSQQTRRDFATAIPILGPGMEHVKEQEEAGNSSGELGSFLGLATGMVLPEAVHGLTPEAASMAGKVGEFAKTVPAGTREAAADALAKTVRPDAALDKVIPGDTITPRQQYAIAKNQGVQLDAAQATGGSTAAIAKKATHYIYPAAEHYETAGAANKAALLAHTNGLLDAVHPEAVTPEAVGTKFNGTLKQHQSQIEEAAGNLYSDLDNTIGGIKPDLTDVRSQAQKVIGQNKNLLKNRPDLISGDAKKAWNIVQDLAKPVSGAIDRSGNKLQTPDTWSDVQKMRSSLIKMTDSPDIIGTPAEGMLKQMIPALDDAMTNPERLGKDGRQGVNAVDVEKLRQANALWEKGKDLYDTGGRNFYNQIRQADPTKVAQSLGDLTPFKMKQIQEAAKATGDESLVPMIQRYKMQGLMPTSTDDVTGLKKLSQQMSAQGNKNKLDGVLTPEQIENMQNVARTSRLLHADDNPSGTAKVLAGGAQGAAAFEGLKGAMGAVAGGHPLGAALAAGTPVATAYLSKLIAEHMNDPAFVDRIMGHTAAPEAEAGGSAAAGSVAPPAPPAPPTPTTVVPGPQLVPQSAPAPATSPAAPMPVAAIAHPAGHVSGIDQESGLPIVDRSQQTLPPLPRGSRVQIEGKQGTVSYYEPGTQRARVTLDDGTKIQSVPRSVITSIGAGNEASAAPDHPQPEATPQGAGGAASTAAASESEVSSNPGQPSGATATPVVPQRIPGVDGGATSLITPSQKLPSQYRMVEADDLQPSHDARTFARNPQYPDGVQERAYDTSKEGQARIIQQAQNYDPDYTVNTNPDAVNGPPVVTPHGVVLGGNSRTMSTQRLYNGGSGSVYRNALKERAAQFGLKPEDVDSMKKPMLVREVTQASTPEEMRRLGSDLNKVPTAAMGTSERAVSAGKNLKPDTLGRISDMMDAQGDGASLRSLMSDPKRARTLLDMMQSDGVVTARERPQFVDTSTGGLSEEGKTFLERAMLGSVVDDPRLMDATPKAVLNKLDGSLGSIAAVSGRADEWNVLPALRSALEEHGEIARRGITIEDQLSQRNMFAPQRNPVVDALVRTMGDKATTVRQRFRDFVDDSRHDVPGQGLLLGDKAEAYDSFNRAFGTHLTDEQFHQGLRDATREEPYGNAAKQKGNTGRNEDVLETPARDAGAKGARSIGQPIAELTVPQDGSQGRAQEASAEGSANPASLGDRLKLWAARNSTQA